jgi:hypothetical protein
MTKSCQPQQYTVNDYNVTIHRGFQREDGKMLWGIRKYKGKRLLEWRSPEKYHKAVKQKKAGSAAVYRRHKAKLNDIKLERGCVLCGFGTHKFPKKYNDHIAMLLEFDHIDPEEKSYNISEMGGYSWELIQSEIDKCRVLCKVCHCKHTGNQNRKEID